MNLILEFLNSPDFLAYSAILAGQTAVGGAIKKLL